MWAGFATFPATYLDPVGLQVLLDSRFVRRMAQLTDEYAITCGCR